METKSEVRVRLKAKLKSESLDHQFHELLATHLIQFIKNHFDHFPDMIGAFAPIQSEPQILEALSSLNDEGGHLSFPTFAGENKMVFRESNPEQLVINQEFGTSIKSPQKESKEVSPNLILVPGLAFTMEGKRLGRGKGFYDRYLENYNGLKIGLCFEMQLETSLPVEDHDQLMDFIITEKRVLDCRQKQVPIGR